MASAIGAATDWTDSLVSDEKRPLNPFHKFLALLSDCPHSLTLSVHDFKPFEQSR